MEGKSFFTQLQEFAANENVLAVAKDVSDLRSKFEDYVLEEERKIQVAELEAEEQNASVDDATLAHKEAIAKEKDDFFELYGTFQQQRKAASEERKATESKHLGEKVALIKRLREVVTNEENIGAAFGALKDIQEQWKTVGDIPREKRNEIETEYSHLLDDFFYNIKIYKDLKDHDFHRNQQLKENLIEDLKKLNSVESIREVETSLKQLQNDWNDIGPVNNEEWERLKEAYWTEVRSLYNKINRFYEDRRSQQLVNLEQKQALVEEVKELIAQKDTWDSIKAWDKATSKVKEVQAKWKTIGFGPRKENEDVWKALRAECDIFFDAKKAYFAVIHEQYDGVANKKKDLIAKAKELKDSTDWRETANKLKQLQNQWKKLGHAGIKHEQKLWKEFRGACDAFFDARQAHYAEQDKQFETNLEQKKELLKTIEGYKPAGDKSAALSDLKRFAEDFSAIGHVPLKAKDEIFQAYKTAMDGHYAALKMEGAEKEKVLFEAKLDTLKASPNSGRALSSLKNDIRKEIDRQYKEITQLENNLGFFSNSKGADALKKDVEKKVNRAKEKIQELKDKLKMIPNE